MHSVSYIREKWYNKKQSGIVIYALLCDVLARDGSESIFFVLFS